MARRRSLLSSRTSRAMLPASDQPEWEVIGPGVRLGYRRGRGGSGRGGTWLAAGRTRERKRMQTRLGRADDIAEADGAGILNHEQAKEAARAWVKTLQTTAQPSRNLTVNAVLDRYLAARAVEGMKTVDKTRSLFNAHVRLKLGRFLVSELTVDQLQQWRNRLATQPKRARTGPRSRKSNIRIAPPSDTEALRRRRDTANRILCALRAALNWAFNSQLVADDRAWRLVKQFRNTSASRVRFLDLDEQRQLLASASGPIRDLIAAALLTGARFGELARLQVRDFDSSSGTIFISQSKSGRARHVPLTEGGQALFERLAAGRNDDTAPLLRQRNGAAWKPATYSREYKATLAASGVQTITFHELRHSYASAMVKAGAPLIVVAEALGHADIRMVTKHYAHLAPSFVAETIRRTAPNHLIV